MNEEQKVNIAKAKLPTKTKIAAWWLIVIGVALIVFYFIYLFLSIGDWADGGQEWSIKPFFILFLGSIFYFISGIFISKKTKWAWIVTVTILFIVAICSLGTYIYIAIYLGDDPYGILILSLFSFLFYLLPLILIILDRKNYLAMIRQRELAK